MSISGALANAYSGLVANSRQAELISNNVANALTPGYGRQDVVLSSAEAGGRGVGVSLSGTVRAADPAATADRRRLEAETAEADVRATASARIAQAFGEPGEAGTLATRLGDLEIALRAAADTPESVSLQGAAVSAAREAAREFNAISTETRRLRMDADSAISREVATVNTSLREIEAINREITLRAATGGDVAALEDQRQRLLDTVASIVPIKTSRRDGDQVAIYAAGGAVLLEGRASELGFTATGLITADMTLASGALSGLTLDGRPVDIPGGAGLMDGGSLAANFEIRDQFGPEANAQIDALARDLIERLQDPAVDTTLVLGDAGLFTDGGVAFDPLNEEGLAGRISINPLVDPEQGGELRRIRDGLNAAVAGDAGEDGLLRALGDALTERRTPAAALGLAGAAGVTDFAFDISSARGRSGAEAEEFAAFRAGRLEVASAVETRTVGVDTDQELQRLILVEQAYSANARVIEVVDQLMRRLLEI